MKGSKKQKVQDRFKCTLKTGVRVERGHGTVPDPSGYVYLYGVGPWENGGGVITYQDVATSVLAPLAEEKVKMEGRDAPSGP